MNKLVAPGVWGLWRDGVKEYVTVFTIQATKYIAEQAGHASAGFTLDRYGHLSETIKPRQVEWIDELLNLDPALCAQIVSKVDEISRNSP